MKGWLLAFFVSGLMWVGIIWGISAFARVLSAEPPRCAATASVCVITGPGGSIRDWNLYVLLNALKGKRFIVPAGWCASACVMAVGLGLHVDADIRIDPAAVLQVHKLALFNATPMPDWFRRRALRRPPIG